MKRAEGGIGIASLRSCPILSPLHSLILAEEEEADGAEGAEGAEGGGGGRRRWDLSNDIFHDYGR